MIFQQIKAILYFNDFFNLIHFLKKSTKYEEKYSQNDDFASADELMINFDTIYYPCN